MMIQIMIVLSKDNIVVFPARTNFLEGFYCPFAAKLDKRCVLCRLVLIFDVKVHDVTCSN